MTVKQIRFADKCYGEVHRLAQPSRSLHTEAVHILVTGSSGTIGTRFCERLTEKGHTFIGVDWRENKWQPAIEAKTVHLDLRDEKALKELESVCKTKKPDIIVHLAANARVYDLVEDPSQARDNFITLFNALEFARTQKIQRFIFSSSREGYGNIKEERLTEDMVRVENCESPYTASKVGGEALVHAYARCYGLETLIFRFSNVYGMYDDSNRVIPLFIRLARAGKPLTVFGKDKCLDFTYIDDNVDGILLGIETFEKAKGGTFNLGNGEGTSIVALAQTVTKLLGSSSAINIGDSRTGEVIHYVADISHARGVLGYNPTCRFDAGIAKTVEWYKANT